MAETYKGLIVAEDGSEVSGEQSKETIATNGGFQFKTEKKDAKSARYEIRLPGFAPHDTHWMDLNRPIRIKLSRGAKVELKIQSDLPMPADAKVSVKGPWYFDNKHCGDFQIGKSGQSIVVPFCPKGTVKFDLHIPGFEEARIRRRITSDTSINVSLKSAKPTQMTVVDAETGNPIVGAKVHFAKRAAAETHLYPFVNWWKPVWAESNSSGEATLNTLREFVPKPSDRDENLKAVYAFCVRSPGYAERWIGGVSRGQDLGIIKLEAALTLRGEIKIDDPESNETNQVSVQYRQANTAMGGDDGIQNWNSAKLVKNKDKLEFELGGLQSGRLDFYVVYHNPTKQKAFFGKITGDSQVKIERNGLVSLNDGFSGRQGSASASEQVPRANAPARVIHAYVPPKEFAITVDGKTPTEHANTKQKMLV